MKTLMVSLLMVSLIVVFSFAAKAGTEGLVLYYAFDEGSGKTVTDLSKTGNDGTFMTDIKWVDGKYEGGIECDQDWVDSGNDDSLNITDELTLEAWVNPQGGGNRIVCVKPLVDTSWASPFCARAQELRSTDTKLRVGSAPNISEPMNGIIDELAIYHRALSQQEIQADMKAPISEQLSVQPALKLTTTWANIKI